jgi:hypothetical protein
VGPWTLPSRGAAVSERVSHRGAVSARTCAGTRLAAAGGERSRNCVEREVAPQGRITCSVRLSNADSVTGYVSRRFASCSCGRVSRSPILRSTASPSSSCSLEPPVWLLNNLQVFQSGEPVEELVDPPRQAPDLSLADALRSPFLTPETCLRCFPRLPVRAPARLDRCLRKPPVFPPRASAALETLWRARPVLRPPCIRQRRFPFTGRAWHGRPPRVRAPSRRTAHRYLSLL